jgi:hypothetical protein
LAFWLPVLTVLWTNLTAASSSASPIGCYAAGEPARWLVKGSGPGQSSLIAQQTISDHGAGFVGRHAGESILLPPACAHVSFPGGFDAHPFINECQSMTRATWRW